MNKRAVVESEVTRAFHPEGSAEPSALACLVLIARQQGLDLSVSQLIHDNLLTNQEVSVPELLKVAAGAELKAELVKLDWKSLAHLRKALPAIVRLKDGANMILRRVEGENEPARVRAAGSQRRGRSAPDHRSGTISRCVDRRSYPRKTKLRDPRRGPAVSDQAHCRVDLSRSPDGSRHRHLCARVGFAVSGADLFLASAYHESPLLQGVHDVLRDLPSHGCPCRI